MAGTTFIALLRAVNVGGRKVAMAPLKETAAEAGFREVRTYIASGNLVLSGSGTPAAVQARLEAAIAARFGLEVPVVVRTAAQWQAYLEPPVALAKAAAGKPGLLLLALANGRPPAGAAKELEARGQAGEQVCVAGDALWLWFPNGSGRSRITPAAVAKAVGAPTTTRNWTTVRKLAGLAAAAPAQAPSLETRKASAKNRRAA
jgi:uncharacterized protein (DUF1697 family)